MTYKTKEILKYCPKGLSLKCLGTNNKNKDLKQLYFIFFNVFFLRLTFKIIIN